ncbi:FHS family L-fucose permease-like MFS transporter [Dysgonomonadaceae bacterium PH5-43]|nr:FHS family L-fucose permease-like MFS transporter [Dysgonomonadaceae bacterium PH5-43]
MSTQKQSGNAAAIIICILLFGMISFVTGLANPMGVIVKAQFGASNFMATLGNLANFLAYAFMGIPAGNLLNKYGYKPTALAAVAVGFVGVGIQFLSGVFGSFGIYLTGAFVAGFSMCMLNTVVNPLLNTLGGGGNKGNQYIQIGGTFNSLMATIVPVLVGTLMGQAANATIQDANPALFIAMGIFAAAFVILALSKIPEPILEARREKEAKGIKEEPVSYATLFKFRHYVLGILCIFAYIGIELGIPNIVNLYLTSSVDKGGFAMDAGAAGTIVGTYWFLMMIGRFVGASIGGKVSSRAMLTTVSAAGLALVTVAILAYNPENTVQMPVFIGSTLSFGMTSVPMSVMLLVLGGLCTSVMWGVIFNLAVEGLGKYTAIGSGVFMVMVVGGGIFPAVQGALADMFSYMQSYWIVFALFAYILYYALVGYKNVNKDIKVD